MRWPKPLLTLEEFKTSIGINAGLKEKQGYSVMKNAEPSVPTLDVNGIWGGYIRRRCKNSHRRVKPMQKYPCDWFPGQDWNEISDLFSTHFQSIAPEGVTVEVENTPRRLCICNSNRDDWLPSRTSKLTSKLSGFHRSRAEEGEAFLLSQCLKKN